MASAKGVKKKEHEKLDDATIERVIALLAAEKPITKKDACEVLNISYNTTRLKNIIEEYEEKAARRKKNFEKTKNTPLSEGEMSNIVLSFLQGYPISDISEFTFRGPAVIRRFLDSLGVPERAKGDDAHKSSFLPDECVLKDEPKPGTILWSAKYHSACELIKRDPAVNEDGSYSYRVYVYEPTESGRRGGFYASQRIEELGSLAHLEKYISTKQLISQK
jgi:hypothetical protein